MAYTTVYKDVVFIEGNHPNAQVGPNVQVDLSFVFGAQLKSLRDVKDNLVSQATQGGFNTIVNFTYGQKSRWLAIDDVAFWGKGNLANLPHEYYKAICETK
jgi:hypothetical protein